MTENLRLAVTTTDCAHVVHAGGDPVVEVRVFDLTPEAAAYILEARKAAYCQVSLAIAFEGEKS